MMMINLKGQAKLFKEVSRRKISPKNKISRYQDLKVVDLKVSRSQGIKI